MGLAVTAQYAKKKKANLRSLTLSFTNEAAGKVHQKASFHHAWSAMRSRVLFGHGCVPVPGSGWCYFRKLARFVLVMSSSLCWIFRRVFVSCSAHLLCSCLSLESL